MRHLLPAAAFSLLAFPAMSEPVAKEPWRTVTVGGEGEVKRVPDKAVLEVTLQRDAKTAKDAKRDVDRLLDATMKIVRDAGVDAKDVRARSSSLQPQYRYPENGKPVLTGYAASHSLEVTVRKLDSLGSLTEALVAGGVDHLDNTTYGLLDENAAKEEALAKALDVAKRKAAILARNLDQSLGQPVAVNESGTSFEAPRPMMRAQMMKADAAMSEAAPAPPAGEIVVRSSLSATFALQ